MKRAAGGTVVALLYTLTTGCIAPQQSEPRAHTPAPPIAGTLYVFHTSSTSEGVPTVEVLRNGKPMTQKTPGEVLIARDKPSVRLSTAPMFGNGRIDATSCEP